MIGFVVGLLMTGVNVFIGLTLGWHPVTVASVVVTSACTVFCAVLAKVRAER